MSTTAEETLDTIDELCRDCDVHQYGIVPKDTRYYKGMINQLERYACLQIEKDRKEAAMEFISKGLIGSADMVTARPINLD